MHKRFTYALLLLAGLATAACGAATPTDELVDARRTYDAARKSNAKELVPADLLSAKQALEKAERAHEEDPQSFREESLAYIAQRKAAQAMAKAGQAQAARDAEDLDQQYKTMQDKMRRQAEMQAQKTAESLRENQERLEDVQNKLSEQDNKLSATAKELRQKEQELKQRQKELEERRQELEKERAARIEAEKQAAAAMKSLQEIAKVQEEKRGLVITLDGAVLFATGKHELLSIARQKLKRVAVVLQEQDDSKKIVVEGHTDSVGTKENNQVLSQKRADAVRSYLVSEGVEADRIKAVGKGESQPIADNKTPEGRANNRRVEIVVK